ncbi:MAG: hypothetical protein PF487_06850 [Bacteroidales bacterium]|jgi:hypothetical protein|nr:hypothetical protein [Bacteroidales bacterium]
MEYIFSYIGLPVFNKPDWLIDYCVDNELELPHEIIIHSMNPYGSENIKSLFNTYFKVYNIEDSQIKSIF